jgi:hypothetical protein
VQDITARRRAEESLHHLAFHDSLTGLPNRRRFHELLARRRAAGAGRPARHAYAVMFLDFDRFKLINDSLGHTPATSSWCRWRSASASTCDRRRGGAAGWRRICRAGAPLDHERRGGAWPSA